jgi:UDP:flavonoid glycosyltransferase YjiC (YdhE family)
VTVLTLGGEVARVRREGLEAFAIEAAIEGRELDDHVATNPIGAVRRAVATFLDRAHLEVDDLRRAITAHRPELLLIDTNAWGAQAAADASGLPWATWHPYPLVFPSRDVPPFGPGLAPARGLFGRLRDRLVRPLATRPVEAFFPRVQALREAAGAPPVASVMAHLMRPPLVLALTAEPFEYARRDWPPNVRLVGPGLWTPLLDEAQDRSGWCEPTGKAATEGRPYPTGQIPIPESRASLSVPTFEKPALLVTCSTEYQADQRLAQVAVEAFAHDPRFTLVVTTGGVDPAEVPAPDGVVVRRFFPHQTLLGRAGAVAAVICHGGMGITQRALAAGVPVLAVPFGRDQSEVGRRVEVAAAGVMLPRRKLSASSLRTALEVTLGRAEGAMRIARAFAATGPERFADALERRP